MLLLYFGIFNVLCGLVYMFIKTKSISKVLFISFIMNAFTMPLLLLGEIGADKRQYKRYRELGGSWIPHFITATIESFYLITLYLVSCFFFGSHPMVLYCGFIAYKLLYLWFWVYTITHSPRIWNALIIISWLGVVINLMN